MKIVLKVIGAVVVCLVLLLVVLRITGLDPKDRRPGLWLSGSVDTTPVADWSFTDSIPTVKLETHPWYLLAHSVTINCVAYDGHLYFTSVYPERELRSWNSGAIRDPHVRAKIGDKLYALTLTYVTDPAEKTAVLQAREKKYPNLKAPSDLSTAHVFRVIGQGPA
jgi:hypothetical protein